MLITATSALDAESETLVNAALASLLRSNHTTISIAHRLSTIKRSDSIIVLSSEGTLAQQGSYEELSRDRNGAFWELMAWQMSGGDNADTTTSEQDSDVQDTATATRQAADREAQVERGEAPNKGLPEDISGRAGVESQPTQPKL